MDVRPYVSADRDACLHVFDSLVPHLIDPADREVFAEFLLEPAGPYIVMDHEGAVAGCGGFVFSAAQPTAALSWGMIRNDLRQLGLGRFLLLYRMREIGKAGEIHTVTVETPPQSAGFYEKQGFRVQGAGERRVTLLKKLTVCP